MVSRGWMRCLIGLVAIAVLGVWSAPVPAAEFSADLVTKMGPQTTTGKIYVKDKKTRMDTETPQAGIIILDMASGTSWMLNPDDKTYLEMKGMGAASSAAQYDEETVEKMADKKVLGTETIDGYECEKILYTYKDKSLGQTTMWIAKKLSLPIKMIHVGQGMETVTEYKNIQEGGVSDSVFAIPSDYEKMEIPGFAPGMIPGMGGSGQ